MIENNCFKLKKSSILGVPLHVYNDFCFIINGERFQTSKIVSDLISRKISLIHANDPTFDEISITTENKGNFSHILELDNFEEKEISDEEIPFIFEIIEKLEIESIEFNKQKESNDLTIENCISVLKFHLKCQQIFSSQIEQEIEFISNNFHEIVEYQSEKLINNIDINIIERIINNENLCIEEEDQLINFINQLYLNDQNNSNFYEYVLFQNVSINKISEFLSIFDLNDINIEIWKSISKRLKEEVNVSEITSFDRYKKYNKQFVFDINNQFQGIINYLRMLSNDEIETEIQVTSSSVLSEEYVPSNTIVFDDPKKHFFSANVSNSWICFNFLNHQIIPSTYTIMSGPYSQNDGHQKSWVIECSNDEDDWTIVDEQQDCSFLNDYNAVHTFNISKKVNKPFKFIRLRQTGLTTSGTNLLILSAFEVYGELI